jgi:hypothetical protein
MEQFFNLGRNLSRRAHKRFSLAIPLVVRGEDDSGDVFITTARTRNASIHGGCVIIDKDLNPGASFRVTSPKGTHFPAKVCWMAYNYRTDQRLLGFALIGEKDNWVLTNGRSHDEMQDFYYPIYLRNCFPSMALKPWKLLQS